MITRDEIQAKSLEFGIHQANVQRDFVFGWLLLGIYSTPALKDILVLKGGNCFRKAYFLNTRFSNDLDFSTADRVNETLLKDGFNQACRFVQENSGVQFEIDRNRVQLQNEIGDGRRVFDVRLYFKDFFGKADHITISLSLDVTELDRIYLPVQERNLIHPYSDAAACSGTIRCWKLEEMLGSKLKCLLQRRHTADVYDLVYSIFVNRDIAVNRGEVLTSFFQKTIYEPSPGVARQLLLGIPLELLRTAWDRYIIAPIEGVLQFDAAVCEFQKIINELFSGFAPMDRASFSFFPSHLRNLILEAGGGMKLMKVIYKGYERIVEPYSLVFKRRKDGHGEEYLYVYDRTGGRSGPGTKSFVNGEIKSLEMLDEEFVQRYPVELSKAGEFGNKSYFTRSFSVRSESRLSSLRHGWRYVIQCNYCNRKFKRMRRNTRLNTHKDNYGNNCYGRIGYVVAQEYV